MLIRGRDPSGKVKYANVTESGDLKVQLSGTKSEVQVLANAATVAPGAFLQFTIETLGADEIWVGVMTDKAPWSVFGTSLPWHNNAPGRAGYDVFYPRRINVQHTYMGYREYATSLLMNTTFGWPELEHGGLPLVQSFGEAMLFTGGYPDEVGIAYENLHETDNATVTLRLLRRWK